MMRVLYAEDDPQVADMVRFYCGHQRDGLALDHVDTGRKALASMAGGGYDVLLLDLSMPDLDGLQVLGELTARRDPTPVIMVSGQGQSDLAVRALRAGATDCIDKNSPDFRRIGEIVARVHQRNAGRKALGVAAPPAGHQILFIDPEAAERSAVAMFFRASTTRLHLSPRGPEGLEEFLGGEGHFDAVVLGPNLTSQPMLDALRHLRGCDETLPVLVVANAGHPETTIAAFKLGARDLLLRGPGVLTELVFSLNNALKQADTQRLATRLDAELEQLNHSLAQQVADRTRELEREVQVRREAESRAEDHAARSQALSNRLLRVQEDERRALAQELHDQVGQLLTGLRFLLEAAQQAAPSEKLTEALSVSKDLLRGVRELTLQLRPRLLDDFGLRPALEWQAKLFQGQTNIAVDLEVSLPETRLAPELETTVFRMVQEALTNVARHSGARHAAVTVTADDAAVQVEITDRGRGFDAAAALGQRQSLGLAGLTERVRLAGGQLELFSQAGQGTRLHAEFKLTLAPHTP